MNILITGGAGFVGSTLAKKLKQDNSDNHIICFDNLRRRGSELNLSEFKELGIEFIHGDIRHSEDFEEITSDVDWIIEASAEPSVHAGVSGSFDYSFDTNLVGTKNCLEFCRKKNAKMIFLSTSRVYSIESMKDIKLDEAETRFEISNSNDQAGLSEHGIAEDFNILNFRSLYGTTKLCSELLIQEYIAFFNMDIVVNRCGVIAGPGQWGKVDQGIFTLWVANHFFGKPLKYFGYGGSGKQVRDLLHPEDLFQMLKIQMSTPGKYIRKPFNLGGGRECSTSLLEYTMLCNEITGKTIDIGIVEETAAVDVPLYLSDCRSFLETSGYKLQKNPRDIVTDIYDWLKENEEQVKTVFA